MAQLIDTSVFIARERQRLDLNVLAGILPDEPIALAPITASELLAGVYYADTEERRQRRQAFVERVPRALPVIPFNHSTARVYARLLVDARTSGQTASTRSFERLSKLRCRPPLRGRHVSGRRRRRSLKEGRR